MDISTRVEKIAFDMGYRVTEDGSVISRKGTTRKLTKNHSGYYRFTLRYPGGHTVCPVHRLAGYQWFNDAVFGEGIEVRHLDGNNQNNSKINLALGTAIDNAADKHPEVRRRCAIQAAAMLRKFTDIEAARIKKEYLKYKSYGKVATIYNVAPSTVHRIVNRGYAVL